MAPSASTGRSSKMSANCGILLSCYRITGEDASRSHSHQTGPPATGFCRRGGSQRDHKRAATLFGNEKGHSIPGNAVIYHAPTRQRYGLLCYTSVVISCVGYGSGPEIFSFLSHQPANAII